MHESERRRRSEGAGRRCNQKIIRHFDAFKKKFSEAAVGHFGSGWAWLVRAKDGSIQVVATHDAGCPVREGQTPIITCDVWRHAYYIDYRKRAREVRRRVLEAGQLGFSRTRICDSRYSTATRSRLRERWCPASASTYDAGIRSPGSPDASSYQITIFFRLESVEIVTLSDASVENCQWSQLWTDDWWVR